MLTFSAVLRFLNQFQGHACTNYTAEDNDEPGSDIKFDVFLGLWPAEASSDVILEPSVTSVTIRDDDRTYLDFLRQTISI